MYAAIAVLALLAATGNGGGAADQRDVVNLLATLPFGTAVVGAVAFGLLGYAVWRAVEAIQDPEGKGAIARLGLFASALTYGGLGIAAIRAALGERAQGSAQGTAREVLSQPGGTLWLILGGLVVLAIGCWSLVKAAKASFMKELRIESMSERELRVSKVAGRVGHAARGIVFLLAGGFLVKAGLADDSRQAGGTEEALRTLAHAPYGPYLLGTVALGLLAYAAYLVVESKYRRMTPVIA